MQLSPRHLQCKRTRYYHTPKKRSALHVPSSINEKSSKMPTRWHRIGSYLDSCLRNNSAVTMYWGRQQKTQRTHFLSYVSPIGGDVRWMEWRQEDKRRTRPVKNKKTDKKSPCLWGSQLCKRKANAFSDTMKLLLNLEKLTLHTSGKKKTANWDGESDELPLLVAGQ